MQLRKTLNGALIKNATEEKLSRVVIARHSQSQVATANNCRILDFIEKNVCDPR